MRCFELSQSPSGMENTLITQVILPESKYLFLNQSTLPESKGYRNGSVIQGLVTVTFLSNSIDPFFTDKYWVPSANNIWNRDTTLSKLKAIINELNLIKLRFYHATWPTYCTCSYSETRKFIFWSNTTVKLFAATSQNLEVLIMINFISNHKFFVLLILQIWRLVV